MGLLASAALAAVILAACGQAADTPGGSGDTAAGGPDAAGLPGSGSTAEPVPADEEPCTPLEELPGGDVANAPVDEDAEFPWNRDDPVVAEGFDFDEIISGGPPPDGIRPIDEPCFTDVETADAWLAPQSPVMTLEAGGETRAYPLAIMTRHEIVNDVLGGEPLVVTYCPLCNSGLAFERTVDGRVLDFGTSGRLFRTNLVMYDRQTKSLWIQFTGRAVVGEDFVGTELTRLPTSLVSWEQFKGSFPDGLVLSRNTGLSSSYGSNPYVGYEDRGSTFLYRGPRDERIDPETRIVGLTGPEDGDAVAVVLDHLRDERVVEVTVAGEPVVVFWAPGTASALDTADIDQGRDVGQTGTFRPEGPDGTRLTFQPAGEPARFTDQETGSTWNLFGEAVSGPLEGAELEEVSRDDTFWFVWFGFQPETRLVGAGS